MIDIEGIQVETLPVTTILPDMPKTLSDKTIGMNFCCHLSNTPQSFISVREWTREKQRNRWVCQPLPIPLLWRRNGSDSVLNHQPHDCLLNRLFRRRSKKTSKLRVTGLCARNSPGTGEFPAQMASNRENVSIWWRHHALNMPCWMTGMWNVISIA